MRKARIKDEGECWYHIVSRTAFQEFKFTDEAKDMFVAMLRRVAYFSGIDVLNHCVMSNHFHVLVHVRRKGEITEGELLGRISALYGADNAEGLRTRWEDMRKRKMLKRIEEEQKAFTRRMGDISPFMKCLKLRYSVWFRHNCGMFAGTLWEGRYKSVLLQGSPATLSAVSAYIDLNPVRAGMVDDTAKYRWSGYGAAMAGDADAMRGIARVFEEDAADGNFARIAENHYRIVLYETGSDALKPEKVKEALARKGKLTMRQMLRCKVRHFLAGVCVGDAEFVEGVFNAHRDHFGANRKTGARGIGLCEKWCGVRLCTARQLVKTPVAIG